MKLVSNQPWQSVRNFGFTLVELLVVISIIGGLAALLITNIVGVRSRAADSTIKNNLNQLKTALRLYYNDYQAYPDDSSGVLLGCGADGDAACSAGGTFSAGASGTVYMQQLPAIFSYYSDGAESFVIIAQLENISDADIATSQTKCDPSGKAYFTGTLDTDYDFVVCSD